MSALRSIICPSFTFSNDFSSDSIHISHIASKGWGRIIYFGSCWLRTLVAVAKTYNGKVELTFLSVLRGYLDFYRTNN